MAYRPGKRKEPLYTCDRDDACYPRCKVKVSADRITAKMLEMQIGSAGCEETPIVFNIPAPCTPALSSEQQMGCGMATGHPEQPVARHCNSTPRSTPCRRSAPAVPEEDMPTECKMSFVTTIEDCSDDSDAESGVTADEGGCKLELSSELMRGLNAAELQYSKFHERLVSSASRPHCTQLVLWKPPESFLQKVLEDAQASSEGPTICEIPDDGVDMSKIEVVRCGRVVVDPDDGEIEMWPSDNSPLQQDDYMSMDIG